MSEILKIIGESELNTVIASIIGIILIAAIFLLIREITCWYFKINEITKLLKEISLKLGNDKNISGILVKQDFLEKEEKKEINVS